MSYRTEHRSGPSLELSAAARSDALAAVNDPIVDARHRSSRSPATNHNRGSVGVGALLAASVATHIIAASLLYSHLVRVLYSLMEDTPRLASLERGLVRILGASVYLPPFAPSVLLVVTALWVGSARRDPRVARALSYGVLALALDTVLRVIGVWVAAPPANVGELLDLPARFSPGPRMFAELAGIQVVGSTTIYWSVVCSLAAFVSVFYVSRALLFAEGAAGEAGGRGRHRARGQAIAAMQHAITSVGAFALIAFLGQLALPIATQLFLRTFG